jgi:hypothetical protein
MFPLERESPEMSKGKSLIAEEEKREKPKIGHRQIALTSHEKVLHCVTEGYLINYQGSTWFFAF